LVRIINIGDRIFERLFGLTNMNNRGVIAGEVSLFVDLGPDEAQEVVQVMSEARLAYQGNAAPTVLSALADRFNALGEEVNSLKHLDSTMEATTSSLVDTLAGLDIDEAGASEKLVQDLLQTFKNFEIFDNDAFGMDLGPSKTLKRLDIAADRPWPPAYFPLVDMITLASANIVASLGGVDPKNPGHVGVLVNSRSTPADLRLVVYRLALINYIPTKDWALFLSPVGFLDRTSRQNWYQTIGPESAVFATTSRFFEYAAEALSSRGKQTARALATQTGRPPARCWQ